MNIRPRGIAMAALVAFAMITSFLRSYNYNNISTDFSCRSRMYISDTTGFTSCARKSSADFYFSFKGNMTGYMIITGTATCDDEKDMILASETINFKYTKEGGFYSLELGKRSKALTSISKLLKDDVVKLNFSPTNSKNYIVNTPLRPIMICTVDSN